jgi:signal transduction histidine kinase
MTKLNFPRRYFLIPAALIVFSVLFYLIYADIKVRTINEFNKEQLVLAETASQGIISFFKDYQSDMIFLSQFDEIVDNTENCEPLVARFYNNHRNLLEAVTRVDEHGIILSTYPRNPSVIGQDISGQRHIQEIIANHQPVISDVFRSVQGYLAIALAVPVFKGNRYQGSLNMLISIDKLGKLYLGKIRIRGTGNVWLLSKNGVEIYCSAHDHIGKTYLDNTSRDSTSAGLLKNIERKRYGTGTSVHTGGITTGKQELPRQFATFYRVPLGNTYWTIIISYQEEDIYIALTRLRNRLLLVFAMLFFIISYYFYSILKVRTVLAEETNRKQAEEYLLHLNTTLEQRVNERTRQLEVSNKELNFRIREVEQLTYIASHDLQEPLRTLTSFTRLIREEYQGKLDEAGNTYIEYIANSASRMRLLVKEILDYSLLGQKRTMTVVDCNKVVSEVLFDMSDAIQSSGTSISAQQLPVLHGYETELRVLFQNLVHNAIKFRKRETLSEIFISAEDQETEWVFSIRDNGIGIQEKDREAVFIMFRRTHSPSEYEGTGIGLAHCKKVVELHGGRIWVESRPNEGSNFIFTIPKN